MQQILAQKLYNYIVDNNPDMLIALQGVGQVSAYIQGKVQAVLPAAEEMAAAGQPAYIIEEISFRELIADLTPSKYNYIAAILSEDFQERFYQLKEAGLLTYEISNLIEECQPLFDHFQFSELTEDYRPLRFAVTGAIQEYFNSNGKAEN